MEALTGDGAYKLVWVVLVCGGRFIGHTRSAFDERHSM